MSGMTNQPPPLAGPDVFSGDRALVEAVRRDGAGWAEEQLREGTPEAIAWGALANEFPPCLRTHDPRVFPDGAGNRFHLQRLKDKLGNRSNASAEIELDGAWARRVREEGRGVRTIVEMVNFTRLDCDRLGRADASGRASGDSPRPPPQRVRQAVGGPPSDAQRARRSRPRVGGRHPALRPVGGPPATARKAIRARHPSVGRRSRHRSITCASARRRTSARRWSASGEMATWKRAECRGSIASEPVSSM
jgi:hypothetical protein